MARRRMTVQYEFLKNFPQRMKKCGFVCGNLSRTACRKHRGIFKLPTEDLPVGRLDKDSEGLLLMTNQGDIVNKILRGGNAHEKEYAVAVNHPVTEEFLKQMCEASGSRTWM